MVARADILAGRAVILVNIQDTVEAQLRSIRSKMRMFSNSMKEIGGDLFRGGLAGTAGSIFPVKEFVNFQDQLLFLQTKLQVTDAAMKPLEKTISTLGMSTSFTSQEVAKAATDFAQAGFSMVEITNSLQASLDLARGSQIDLSTSTTILANAIRTFNVDTERASEFASKFIAAARLGTLDLVDLSESLKYSSGTFALLNVEIDEVLGLITQLSKSSLKASLAGTSLNTAFLNLAGSADKLKELLGVVFTDEDFEQPLIVLTKIEKALQGMSTTKKISIVQDLVNIRGARAVFGEIIQDLGKLDETTQQIRNSTDEARLSAEKLDSRLGGVWRRARSAFEESLLAIGATTEGPLTRFGEIMAKVFNDISRLAQQNEVLTQSILGMGVASLAAGVGILALSTLFGRLAMFITPLTLLNAQLFKMAGALVGLQLKTIGGIGGAIAAPVLARQQRISKARVAVTKTEEALVKARTKYTSNPSSKNAGKLGAATVASKNALSAFKTTTQIPGAETLKGIGSSLKSVLTTATKLGLTIARFSRLVGLIPAVVAVIGRTLARAASSIDWVRVMYRSFQGAWTAVRGIFTVLNGIRRVVFSFSGILTIVELLILFGDKIPGISDLLTGAGKAFSTLFKNLGETVKSLAPTFDHLGTAIKLMFTGDAMSGIAEAAKAFANMRDLISLGLTNAWQQFVADTKPFADWMKVTLLGTLYTIEALFNAVASNLGTVFKSGKILISPEGDFLEVLRNTFSIENMKVFFVGLLEFIGSIGSSLNTVISSVAQILEVIKRSMFGVLQTLATLPGEQGATAQAALNPMDKNFPLREHYKEKIANIDKELESLLGDGTTTAVIRRQQLVVEKSRLQDLVTVLTPVLAQSDTRELLLEQNRNLANMIAEAIAKVNGIPTGPAPGGFGPQTVEEAKLEAARKNAEADALAAKTIGTPISNLLQSVGGFFGSNVPIVPKIKEATSNGDWFSNMFKDVGRDSLQISRGVYDNNPLQGETRAATNEFLRDPKKGITDAFNFFGDGLKSIYNQPDEVNKTVEAVKATMPTIGKALVGTFDSTRGNLLQGVPTMEKLQREANDKLDEGNDKLDDVVGILKQGATFIA